ncbi:MAG: trigger factor [Acidobacteria bacterium]|nr:trigger factor [Acidobacteriota bacterium]
MLLNYEDLSPVRKSVEVEIPSELIENESKRVTNEFAKQAKIPGFRPGKVPVGIVRNRFAKDIQEEVMNRLLPVTFREAVKEKDVEPVGEPHLEHVDPFIEGAPIKYKAEFDVKPKFELGEYRGLEVEEQTIEVAEADIDEMIERLREQASVYRLEADRGLQDGDYAMIEITSQIEGAEPQTDAGHFKMGEETPLPEMQAAMFGKKPGESGSFEKTYNDDANNEAFRGKTVRHEVVLKEVRVQEKPEVTDEFAKSVGGFESVAEMRERIGEDIRLHRESEALRVKRNRIGDRLLAAHQFEVPDSLVEEELGKSLNNYARYLASQGIDIEKAELDWRKISDEFRPEAVKRVKRSLILEQVAKKEGLIVSDVEVDAEIRRASNDQGREFAEVKHRLRHDGGYEALRASMAQEKALELVLGAAHPPTHPGA